MSSATGQVRFFDGVIMWFRYDGTGDVCIDPLWENQSGLSKNWRSEPDMAPCLCGQDEPCDIACNYGAGMLWSGRACRKCRVFTLGDDMIDVDEQYDLPSWWVR